MLRKYPAKVSFGLSFKEAYSFYWLTLRHVATRLSMRR